MDQCLARQFLRLKRAGVKPMTWLQSHSLLMQMIVPACDLEAVIKCAGAWETVAANIARLTENTVVGRTVFGFCGTLVSASQYKTQIENLLIELKKTGVTDDTLADFKIKAQAAADTYKAAT